MAVAEVSDDELSAARQALQDFEEEPSSARRLAEGESSASPR